MYARCSGDVCTCLVAILRRDRCTAIQVSFCFERREKGVLEGLEEKLGVRGGNNGESAILFIDTCVLSCSLRLREAWVVVRSPLCSVKTFARKSFYSLTTINVTRKVSLEIVSKKGFHPVGIMA